MLCQDDEIAATALGKFETRERARVLPRIGGSAPWGQSLYGVDRHEMLSLEGNAEAQIVMEKANAALCYVLWVDANWRSQ